VSLRSALLGTFYAAHRHLIELPRDERVVAALARCVGRADSVLDVGCSHGRLARDVAARVGATQVRGVDVRVPAGCAVDAAVYDGVNLPFADASFDAVLLSDVLHHAEQPEALLVEALRVARRVVAVKDHCAFGPASRVWLTAMDVVGNGASDIVVRGRYLSMPEWLALAHRVRARVASLEWPLRIHDAPFRFVAPDALQLALALEPPHAARDESAWSAQSDSMSKP
jgi:SAM-dependent methyltransferase